MLATSIVLAATTGQMLHSGLKGEKLSLEMSSQSLPTHIEAATRSLTKTAQAHVYSKEAVYIIAEGDNVIQTPGPAKPAS